MRPLPWLAFTTVLLTAMGAQGAVDARLMRYPAVSATQIAFTYAGDLWVVPKTGGVARPLTTPKGEESFPRFSPDGRELAFSGNYDGNTDVYVMPASGGVPVRVTSHPMTDRLIDWCPDGKSLLLASGMESGRDRFNKIFKVGKNGGLPEALPVPYGEFAALSPDGKTLAYLPISTDFRTWKRYRGGMASEIWFFDLEKRSAFRLPSQGGSNDSMPMWHGETFYFLSDRDAAKRSNIWSYNLKTKAFKQITFFKDFDVHFPSIGPEDLVLEAGGRLYRVDLASEALTEVKVEVTTDQTGIRSHQVNASRLISNVEPSPQGKRAIFEARGELFSVPAEEGYVINLTQSSGVAERYPALSADGKQLAYFSDRSGEYELWVRPADGQGHERQVTHLGPGYRYNIFWSPDGKRVVFIDKAMSVQLCDVDTGKVQTVDKGLYLFHGGLENFRVDWSRDSRWFTYCLDTENRRNTVRVAEARTGKVTPVTTSHFDASDAVFDPEGKYLFLVTGQHFAPTYSDMDTTWVYSGSSRLAAIPLRNDVPSPLAARNNLDSAKEGQEAEAKDATSKKGKDKDKEKDKEKADTPKAVDIDLEGMEGRMVLLPPAPGNLGALAAVKGKVIYQRSAPPSGEEGAPGGGALCYYDLEKREEKTILSGITGSKVASGGTKVLVAKKNVFAFVDIQPDQKIDKQMPTGDLPMTVDPRAEWRQIFNDAWRVERDFFYDPGMHGVDWKAMRERYGKLIEDCATREDVNFVLGELISELNASHAYRGGGDEEIPARVGVGLLGADYALENGAFRIKTILRGSPWDAQAKGPLAEPGLGVKPGDYLLAVNHQPLDITKAPWAPFQGLAGKTVLLTVSDKPTLEGAREITVQTLASEAQLRYQAWVEAKRQYVDKASGGRIGYVYVPDTGVNGQTELVRQFYGQYQKDGLIIDERWNSGGQIPDRFVELLRRKSLNRWAVRDGKDWQWPPVSHDGPMAMLINGWSGSGGDAFPFYFKQAGLGPLIGRRTWGGLIGISGAPTLMDGGGVTAPTFGIYSNDGKWIIEGYGVDPDIEVMDDPALLAQGKDPQLDRALAEVEASLRRNPVPVVTKPAYPDRSGR